MAAAKRSFSPLRKTKLRGKLGTLEAALASNLCFEVGMKLFFVELGIAVVCLGSVYYYRVFYSSEIGDPGFTPLEAVVRGKSVEGGSGIKPGISGHYLVLFSDDAAPGPSCRGDAAVSAAFYAAHARGDRLPAYRRGRTCYLKEDERWGSTFDSWLSGYLLNGGGCLLHMALGAWRAFTKLQPPELQS